MRRLGWVLLGSAILLGCGGEVPGMTPDREPASCFDRDGDGYGWGEGCRGEDCDETDPGCHAGPCCLGPCEDGYDNDGDGWIDAEDPDCAEGDTEDGFGLTECNDGLDNDGDGFVDGADPDCSDAGGHEWSSCPGDGSLVDLPGGVCCPGLRAVPAVFITNGLCEPSAVGVGVCVSNCGDGICEEPAEPCSCPEDCTI